MPLDWFAMLTTIIAVMLYSHGIKPWGNVAQLVGSLMWMTYGGRTDTWSLFVLNLILAVLATIGFLNNMEEDYHESSSK